MRVCSILACRQMLFLVFPPFLGGLGHLPVKVNATISLWLLWKMHWKSSSTSSLYQVFNCIVHTLPAEFFFLLPDCCWECASVLQKALMGICCIPVTFLHYQLYIVHFFHLPLWNGCRISQCRVTWNIIFSLLIIGEFVYFSVTALIFINISMLMFSPAICLWLGLVTVASRLYPGMGTGGGMKTSHLTRGSPVSKGEGEGSQSAYCLHNLCEIPLHIYVPKCFPGRGSSWDFGCYLKSLKMMPMVQNSCT